MFLYRNEKEYIEKLLISEKFEFIVLYLGRRIWKKILVKNIVSEKNWFYYLWLKTGYIEQLNLLREKFSIFLDDKILMQIDFKNSMSLFEYVIKQIWINKKTIITLDEFQYFFYKKPSVLIKYLQTLQEIKVVKKETPILDNPLKSKKWLYKIDDFFIKFWFTFIWWKIDEIEFNNEEYIEELKQKFDYYVSQTIYPIIYNYIRQNIKLDFNLSKIWREWYKNYEFDICEFDSKKENLLLWEIKWTNKKIDFSVLKKLQDKSKYIKEFKKKVFILVSKKWFTDDVLKLESEELILLDVSKVNL